METKDNITLSDNTFSSGTVYITSDTSGWTWNKSTAEQEEKERVRKMKDKFKEIVTLWRDRKKEQSLREYNESRKSLNESDANYQKLLESFIDSVSEFETETKQDLINIFVARVLEPNETDICTAETKAAGIIYWEEHLKRLNEYERTEKEVGLMLDSTETYEQGMAVLRAYDIVDEKGRLNA